MINFVLMNSDISLFRRPIWLFFDLDDTLWNFKGNSIKALHHVYNSFPLIRQRFNSYDEFETVYHHHNAAVWKAFAEGKMTSGFIKTERWRATLFPEIPASTPPHECTLINEEYLSNLASYPDLIPHAREILDSLSKNFMIAVLSNGFTATQYAKLNNSGILKYITRVVVSEETDAQKPDSRFFKYAIDETGASGTPVMIGDNPDTDIIGALKAGWRAAWLNPDSKPFPISDYEFEKPGIDKSLFLGSFKSLREIHDAISQLS